MAMCKSYQYDILGSKTGIWVIDKKENRIKIKFKRNKDKSKRAPCY